MNILGHPWTMVEILLLAVSNEIHFPLCFPTDMRQLLEVVYQMRHIKNDSTADDMKILKELVEQKQSGSLPARDAVAAKEISTHTWGNNHENTPSVIEDSEKTLQPFLEKHQEELDIVIHDSLVQKTQVGSHTLEKYT